jgi:flavorubredoxin/NADPH-dependent 2,4-dienoyl-CoA reductase/sulfur reductase-like enzyme
MDHLQLKNNLFWVGIEDYDLRTFDIVMHTEYGTSYNSYLLKGSEKTALVETAKVSFFDDYRKHIESICDIKDIDYIIMDHTEPDHAGSIEKLIMMNPEIKVVATPTAINFLKEIINRDFYSIAVKENDTLSLGDKTLQFMILPNLHWPDTMYTYDVEDKALFTCDSFGSHYATEEVLRSKVTDEQAYFTAAKYYFDHIIGPFKNPYMINGLERIKDLDIDLVCTGHGPVLDSHIEELFDLYRNWCTPGKPNDHKTVVIPYVSAYGYTAQLARQIAKGIHASGNVAVKLFDMVQEKNTEKVSAEILLADAVLFGTPTIVGEALAPIWALTASMDATEDKGKLASAFGSYGWSGEGVPHILERLKQLHMNVVDGFRVRFKPDENQLKDAYDYGYHFGCKLLNRELKSPVVNTGKLVKCVICGAIFDASITVCPVCGAGEESFVPYEEETKRSGMDSDRIYVILGGGAAAVSAAEAIRQRDTTGVILMFNQETELPYNRPMLTKALLADFSSQQIAIYPQAWFDENKIQYVNQALIEKLNTSNKTIFLKDGRTFHYDKCIYALGASSFIPPIEGAQNERVKTIRTLSDVAAIQNLIHDKKRAVLIGGGILGLEAAWELSKAGKDVTVLEAMDRLMPRQLDAQASQMVRETAEKHGLHMMTGVKITQITENGEECTVHTENGEYPCDLVIISAGVRANVILAKDAGMECERAVVVNAKMETSTADVYACGDCAQYKGMNYALWSQALEEGRIAGANAAGDTLEYEPDIPALTFFGLDTQLFAAGDLGSKPDQQYKTLEIKDEARNVYRKAYFLNSQLCGIVLIGDISKMRELIAAMKEQKFFADAAALIV